MVPLQMYNVQYGDGINVENPFSWNNGTTPALAKSIEAGRPWCKYRVFARAFEQDTLPS